MLPGGGAGRRVPMTKQQSDALVVSKRAQEWFARLRTVGAKPCATTVDDFNGGYGVKISVEFGTAREYFGTMVTAEWQADQFFVSVLDSIGKETAGTARNRTHH
jgi:hypothetical protein